MTRLNGICLSILGSMLGAGCSGGDAPGGGVAPEPIPDEVERVYQEREALKFGLDQLEREEQALQRASAGAADSEINPRMNANERE